MHTFFSVLIVLTLSCCFTNFASGQIQCNSPSQNGTTTNYNMGNGSLYYSIYFSGVCYEAGAYGGGEDTFDDAVAVKINERFIQNYTYFNTTGDPADNTIDREFYVTFQETVEGLLFSRKVYFPANAPWGRWLEIIKNPTAQDISVNFTLMGDSGHDGETHVWASSTYPNGTNTSLPWTPTDYFVCLDDSTNPGDDEPDCFGYYWPGGLAPYAVSINTTACYGASSVAYGYEVDFHFTVPAGETRIIMQAWAIGYDRANVLPQGQNFGTFPASLLAGISDTERCLIVNAPPCATPTSSSAARNIPFLTFDLF